MEKKKEITEPIEATVLGKKVSHPQQYAPDILVAVPRILNRIDYGLESADKFFTGSDIWHAWEISFLTQRGLPVNGAIKFVYDCYSEFIVESKSLKLYLNSFNMSRFGSNEAEAIDIVCKIISSDLSNLLKTDVQVGFFQESDFGNFDFTDYVNLEKNTDLSDEAFDIFSESPEILKFSLIQGEESIYSNLLRSNCKITHQPDWGTVFIYYKADKTLDRKALARYLVSFRNENHFHEEICEMIFKRLFDLLNPEKLMVTCIYTRRGGIDICPVRATNRELLKIHLLNPSVLTRKLLRQ